MSLRTCRFDSCLQYHARMVEFRQTHCPQTAVGLVPVRVRVSLLAPGVNLGMSPWWANMPREFYEPKRLDICCYHDDPIYEAQKMCDKIVTHYHIDPKDGLTHPLCSKCAKRIKRGAHSAERPGVIFTKQEYTVYRVMVT